jgi:hypothetical protein
MAFTRSAVRSRLAPPIKYLFYKNNFCAPSPVKLEISIREAPGKHSCDKIDIAGPCRLSMWNQFTLRRRGLLYEKYKKHFGHGSVWI